MRIYNCSVKFSINPRMSSQRVRDIERSDIADLRHDLGEIPNQANLYHMYRRQNRPTGDGG